jgi:hypothetical protein
MRVKENEGLPSKSTKTTLLRWRAPVEGDEEEDQLCLLLLLLKRRREEKKRG